MVQNVDHKLWSHGDSQTNLDNSFIWLSTRPTNL
jgi:hypothetical protein